MNKPSENKEAPIKVIAQNKKARFEYHFIETFEVGIVLTGDEIKSIRASQITLTEAYVRAIEGELFLIGSHIAPYSHSSAREYNPTRSRKLLMQKKQIIKLQVQVTQKGLTIVPVQIYLKKSLAKLTIALAKGKDAPDKRRTVQDRELKKRAERAVKMSR